MHWSKDLVHQPSRALNKDDKRRVRVVGIFTHETSIDRLVGMTLADTNDEWTTEERHYLSEGIHGAPAPRPRKCSNRRHHRHRRVRPGGHAHADHTTGRNLRVPQPLAGAFKVSKDETPVNPPVCSIDCPTGSIRP